MPRYSNTSSWKIAHHVSSRGRIWIDLLMGRFGVDYGMTSIVHVLQIAVECEWHRADYRWCIEQFCSSFLITVPPGSTSYRDRSKPKRARKLRDDDDSCLCQGSTKMHCIVGGLVDLSRIVCTGLREKIQEEYSEAVRDHYAYTCHSEIS